MKKIPGLALVSTTTIGLLLAGCAATSPNVDSRFGSAVTAARTAQMIDPGAGAKSATVAGVDGAAAAGAMERYRTSFKTPPEPVNVFNIGVGASSGGH